MTSLASNQEFKRAWLRMQQIVPAAKIFKVKQALVNGNLQNDTSRRLLSIRRKAIEAETWDIYLEAFTECWQLLSSAENEIDVSLPPMFLTPFTDALIHFLNPVFTMKRYFEKKAVYPVGTGSCKIFSGPKGVGKTTILRVFFTLGALLTDHVISVYWSYDSIHSSASVEAIPNPYEVLKYVIKNEEVDAAEAVTFVNDQKKMVVLLADEVQCLYLRPSSINDNARLFEKAKEIIAHLAICGKSEMNVVFATGSSVNTVQHCLHPLYYDFDGYASLNESVFKASFIHPIREFETFQRLLKLLLGTEESPDERRCRLLFNLSGGVGGELESFRNGFTNVERQQPNIPDLYDSDVALRQILHELYLKIHYKIIGDDLAEFDWWSSHCYMDYARALEIIRIHHYPTMSSGDQQCLGVRKLNEYVDQSILITETGRSKVTVLIPAVLFQIRKTLLDEDSVSGMTRMQSMALEGVFTGWCSNVSEPEPSAGHAVEQPLLQLCVENGYFATTQSAFVLLDEVQTFPLLPLNHLNLCLFPGVKTCSGLDGILFETNDNCVYNLRVVQIKCGRLEMKISRHEWKKCLSQAVEGVEYVLKSLKSQTYKNKKGPTVVVKELLFLTSKVVSVSDEGLVRELAKSEHELLHNTIITIVDQSIILDDLAKRNPSLVERLRRWIVNK